MTRPATPLLAFVVAAAPAATVRADTPADVAEYAVSDEGTLVFPSSMSSRAAMTSITTYPRRAAPVDDAAVGDQ